MTQLNLFEDRFTIQMALFAFSNWLALEVQWFTNPELCEDDHKERKHKQDVMWRQYSAMAGVNRVQLVKHAAKNGHLLDSDRQLLVFANLTD